MTYTKLELAQFPCVLFAHGYKTERYALEFTPLLQCIEITLVEQGDVTKWFKDGSQVHVRAPGVLVNFRDTAFSLSSDAPLHRHSTVCISVKNRATPVSAKQVLEMRNTTMQPGLGATAIVPAYFEINQYNTHIENRLKKIIRYHSQQNMASSLIVTGLVMELIGEITEECMRSVMLACDEGFSLGNVVYSRRAMEYIARHLEEKIKVEDIAKALEISAGYLSNVFKSVQGETIVSYINRTRLDKVKEILTANPAATLKQAGESVGIDNESYLSRIFKQYTGITVREYRMLQADL